MSRIGVTYPPDMLPKASDPEKAQVIICQPNLNEGPVQAGALLGSPTAAYQLIKRAKLQ